MRLTFLGTGGAQQVPVFGCDCPSCRRAQQLPLYRRGPCSALIQCDGESTLLDAGQCHLEQRFRPGELQRILLTHYHMDHVQGLFPLRWGVGAAIQCMGRRMTPVATICSNTRGYWPFSRRSRRLWRWRSGR